jgi:exopolysaccharide biosynthesis polyprenyl glycosylphosphotransferase
VPSHTPTKRADRVSTVLRQERSSRWVDSASISADAVAQARFSARWKHALTWAGRAAAVVLPSAGLAYPRQFGIAGALGLTLLLIGCWWVPLRIAFHTALRALGAAAPAAVGTSIGLVLASALALWFPVLHLGPLTLLNIAVSIFLFTTGWETLVQKLLARRQKVLVLGGPRVAADVAAAAERDSETNLEVVGVVADSDGAQAQEPPLLGNLAELGAVVEAQQPDLIVLADADPGPAVDRLLESSWRKFRVVGVSHFFEHAFGRVPLTHISPAWFMCIMHLRQPSYDGWSKRAFDVVVAVMALVFTMPLLALIATAVRLSGGPVFFTQTRLGERGKTFRMYKFRTMIPSGEADGCARWADELDSRITCVGRMLRRTRLDELPQLWNVVRGEMSIVGPRPERPEFMCVLEEKVPFWNRRLLVKPGITGWAQIRNGYAADHESTIQKLSYDLWYMRHRTLLLDLLICVRTLATVVSGAGAR